MFSNMLTYKGFICNFKGKKVMKNLLLFAMLLTVSASAQNSYLFGSPSYGSYKDIELIVPVVTLSSTFLTNQYLIGTSEFQDLSLTRQNQITRSIYFTGVLTTFASHYVIKYIKNGRKSRLRSAHRAY